MPSKTRQSSAIVCFVIALILAGIATKNVFFTDDIPVTHESGLGVSNMVGAFLPAIVFAIIGTGLIQKQKT